MVVFVKYIFSYTDFWQVIVIVFLFFDAEIWSNMVLKGINMWI